MMKKLLVALGLAMATLLFLALSYVVISRPGWFGRSAPSATPVGGMEVTKTGTIACLVPADTSGPVNSSCALGLKADDGVYYALSASDPVLVGSVPTGRTVRVTGTLVAPTSGVYQTAGTINVITLKQL